MPGNERYLFHSREPLYLPAIAARARVEFPELRAHLPQPSSLATGQSQESVWPEPLAKTDVSKAERVFGYEWKSPWASVKETIQDLVRVGVFDGEQQ